MPTNLIEDYAYVRSRDTDSEISNISVLELVEEMVRAPGDHHWEVHSSGTLPPNGSEQYYLILSGSDPDQPAQRIAFLASSDSFEVGYDPDGTVEWDDDGGEFVHDDAFSGLRTLAGSTLELVDDELVPFDLVLNDEAPIRVWLAEHREANDCGETCSPGLAASLTLLIEKLGNVETENRFVYGAHVGRVLSSANLNDQHRGIYGDAVLVGEPNTPGRLGPEGNVSDPDYRSWLGQPNNVGGSVVRVGPEEWAAAYGVGWDNHLPEGSLKDVASSKRVVPYGVNGLDEDALGDWLMVSTAKFHSLGIRNDGTLWVWGDGNNFKLGLGDDFDAKFQPTQITKVYEDVEDMELDAYVEFLGPWKHVSAGSDHSVAITVDGRMYTFGANTDSSILGLNSNNPNLLAKRPTRVTKYIDPANYLGANLDSGVFDFEGTWISASAGEKHTLAIAKLANAEALLFAFGDNFYGQCGQSNTDLDFKAPAFVDQIKLNPSEDSEFFDGPWQSVAAGSFHSLAIASNGSLYSFGSNDSGRTGLGNEAGNTTTPTRINQVINETNPINFAGPWQSVAAGSSHSLAIASNGSLYSFGSNDSGRTGLGNIEGNTTTPTRINQVINETNPINFAGPWQSVAVGNAHSLIIASNGNLYSFGQNVSGGTGLGIITTGTNTITPTLITLVFNNKTSDETKVFDGNWFIASAGVSFSLVIDSKRKLYSFGVNHSSSRPYGTLGIGTTISNKSRPTKNPFSHIIYNAYTHGEVGRTKYLRQFGTEPLAHGVKFVSTTPLSLQAWLPSGNGSNQLILWRRGDDNDAVNPIEPELPEDENDL